MKKFVVSLKLDKKSVPEKIEFGRHVYDFMLLAIGTFTAPSPTLNDLKNSVGFKDALCSRKLYVSKINGNGRADSFALVEI